VKSIEVSRLTQAELRRLADQVWAEHDPDDSGLCRVCRISRCRPRAAAGEVRGLMVAGLSVPVIGQAPRTSAEAVEWLLKEARALVARHRPAGSAGGRCVQCERPWRCPAYRSAQRVLRQLGERRPLPEPGGSR
jgi:hypothetical protein